MASRMMLVAEPRDPKESQYRGEIWSGATPLISGSSISSSPSMVLGVFTSVFSWRSTVSAPALMLIVKVM